MDKRRSSKPLKKSSLTYQIKKERKFKKNTLIYPEQTIKQIQKPSVGRPINGLQKGKNSYDPQLIKIQFQEQNNMTYNLQQKQQRKNESFFDKVFEDELDIRKNKLVDQIENQKINFNRNYLQKMKNLQRFDEEPNQKEISNNQEQTQFNMRQELKKCNANSGDDSDKTKIKYQPDMNQNSSRKKQSSHWNFKNFVQTSDKKRLSCSQIINDRLNQLKLQKPKPQQRLFRNMKEFQRSSITEYEQICKKVQAQVFQNYKKSYHYQQSLNLNTLEPENMEMIKKQFIDSFTDKMRIILGETAMKCRVPVSRIIYVLQKSHF